MNSGNYRNTVRLQAKACTVTFHEVSLWLYCSSLPLHNAVEYCHRDRTHQWRACAGQGGERGAGRLWNWLHEELSQMETVDEDCWRKRWTSKSLPLPLSFFLSSLSLSMIFTCKLVSVIHCSPSLLYKILRPPLSSHSYSSLSPPSFAASTATTCALARPKER